ncbi:methionine ABC transporter permease [Acinetobacter puyangensis]|uniref:methionine ABC transporter permease n=1 Tax=Acinetobacter puyangensis TaxID=1096779 RepID=UPI003A4E2055
MIFFALIFIIALGLPTGIFLYLFSSQKIFKNTYLYGLISFITNIIRSIPFIILLILLMPITTWITGTAIGVKGVIPPLVVAGTAFFARLIETALREVDQGVIEAAQAMGASRMQIVFKVLLPESTAGIIAAITVTAIGLVDYSAMAGVIGAGGLGDMAIRYGYQRYETEIMMITVFLLILLVQLFQFIGNKLVIYVSRH